MSVVRTNLVTPALSRGLPAFGAQDEGGSRVKPGMTIKL